MNKKYNIIIFLLLFSFSLFAQQIKTIKTDIFTVVYSEIAQQPLELTYVVTCPNGTFSRSGKNFWVPEGVNTSDDKDYKGSVYDKGHLAPAASFSCTEESLHQSFSYLNSVLQHQGLNRGQWSQLEAFERDAANFFGVDVKVKVEVLFDDTAKILPTGAMVPTSFRKTIDINGTVRIYEFPNIDTKGTDWVDYRTK
tara:strand:+ start:125 stop:712 length:588 start_codon:yes stop_codon:yes gene_type:complete